MSLAKDMADLLATQGVGTVGTNIYYGMMPDHDDAPDECIAVIATSPLFLNPKWKRDELTFQVLIRGSKRSYETAAAKAKAVMDALLGIDNQTVNGNTYLQWNITSGPSALGYDSRERAAFSVNFRCVQENASGGVRSTY